MKLSSVLTIGLVLTTAGVRAEFKLSEFDERYETKRRKAFTEWVTAETLEKEYARYDRKGQFPIYHESSEQGERRLYEDNPDGFAYQIWSLYGERDFCEKNKMLQKDGYVLLTASGYTSENGHTLYRGIWVSRDVEERMLRVIRRYGISQAVISADHVPAGPAKKSRKKKKQKS